MVKLIFSVHTITEAKQSNRQGGARAGARAEPGPEPGRWIFQPGHLTPWCSVATARCMSPFLLLYTTRYQQIRNTPCTIKTCHFVSDCSSVVCWMIFTIFVPVRTGMNTVQFIYRVALKNCSKFNATFNHYSHIYR